MDIASLRAKLDNIAEELAQLPEQESVAVEEEQVEEVEAPVAEEDSLEIEETEEVAEEEVEETVEVPVAALAELMQLAGYTNYADKLAEYENEPEEEYSDTEDQLIGLSGGLNGPKKMYPAAAGGDNPMDQEPREIEEDAIVSVEESLYKSYKSFLEEAEIKDDEVVAEGKMSPEDELEMLKANVKNPAQSDEAKEKMKARIKELEEMIKKED